MKTNKKIFIFTSIDAEVVHQNNKEQGHANDSGHDGSS